MAEIPQSPPEVKELNRNSIEFAVWRKRQKLLESARWCVVIILWCVLGYVIYINYLNIEEVHAYTNPCLYCEAKCDLISFQAARMQYIGELNKINEGAEKNMITNLSGAILK